MEYYHDHSNSSIVRATLVMRDQIKKKKSEKMKKREEQHELAKLV